MGYVDTERPDDSDECRILDSSMVLQASTITCTSCGDEGATQISEWLINHAEECKLTRLCLTRLRGDAICCKGATSISHMLAHNSTITHLELGNNRSVRVRAHFKLNNSPCVLPALRRKRFYQTRSSKILVYITAFVGICQSCKTSCRILSVLVSPFASR
jgi:hypothetical protein